MSTLKQLRQRVQHASDRSVGGSDTEVNALVNDAYQAVTRDLRSTFTSAALTLVAGKGDYAMAADLAIDALDVKYIEFRRNGLINPLEPVSFDEILRLRGLSTALGGAAYYYSIVPPDFLSIYPVPQAGDTGNIWYWSRPALLVVDADSVDTHAVPEDWQELIVLHALAQSMRTITMGKGVTRYASTASISEHYREQYRTMMTDYRKWRNRFAGSRSRSIQVGNPRRPRYSNDTYISPAGGA